MFTTNTPQVRFVHMSSYLPQMVCPWCGAPSTIDWGLDPPWLFKCTDATAACHGLGVLAASWDTRDAGVDTYEVPLLQVVALLLEAAEDDGERGESGEGDDDSAEPTDVTSCRALESPVWNVRDAVEAAKQEGATVCGFVTVDGVRHYTSAVECECALCEP